MLYLRKLSIFYNISAISDLGQVLPIQPAYVLSKVIIWHIQHGFHYLAWLRIDPILSEIFTYSKSGFIREMGEKWKKFIRLLPYRNPHTSYRMAIGRHWYDDLPEQYFPSCYGGGIEDELTFPCFLSYRSSLRI